MSQTGMHRTETIFDGFLKLESWHVPGADFPHIIIRTSDSAAGLLVDTTNRRALFVRQARPAMVRDDNPSGTVEELVAGRFDVSIGPKALLVKEAAEEVGVTITEDDVQILNGGAPVSLSAGVLTERCFLLYAEITPDALDDDDDDKERGADGEGEAITRFWVNFDDLEGMTFQCARVMALVMHLRLRLAQGALE